MRRLVCAGWMMSSMKPRLAAGNGLANLSTYLEGQRYEARLSPAVSLSPLTGRETMCLSHSLSLSIHLPLPLSRWRWGLSLSISLLAHAQRTRRPLALSLSLSLHPSPSTSPHLTLSLSLSLFASLSLSAGTRYALLLLLLEVVAAEDDLHGALERKISRKDLVCQQTKTIDRVQREMTDRGESR